MDEPFVVKVQRSQFDSEGAQSYLLYSEDRSWELVWPVGESPVLDEAMGTAPKRYFWARMDDNSRLEILSKLPCDQVQLW